MPRLDASPIEHRQQPLEMSLPLTEARHLAPGEGLVEAMWRNSGRNSENLRHGDATSLRESLVGPVRIRLAEVSSELGPPCIFLDGTVSGLGATDAKFPTFGVLFQSSAGMSLAGDGRVFLSGEPRENTATTVALDHDSDGGSRSCLVEAGVLCTCLSGGIAHRRGCVRPWMRKRWQPDWAGPDLAGQRGTTGVERVGLRPHGHRPHRADRAIEHDRRRSARDRATAPRGELPGRPDLTSHLQRTDRDLHA